MQTYSHLLITALAGDGLEKRDVPISYWDPRYGARIFAPIEPLLDLAVIGYWV